MMGADWLIDGTLVLLLLSLAGATLHARSLYASVVLFIAMGLIMALVWARLGAVDLALAEAAISAGLTGVLLFASLSRMGLDSRGDQLRYPPLPALLLPLSGGLLLLVAVWPLPEQRSSVAPLVDEFLADSGVSHPVTGVLLNFRAWDTLLEVLVVLLALLGVRELRPTPESTPDPWLLLTAWGRLLVPLLTVFGGYLLWRGSSAPGGAFQAGAILAAGAVVLRLNGLLPAVRWRQGVVRALVLVGLGTFVAVAVFTAWLGEGWLVYPPGWAKPLILAIETMATLSIAVSLTLLVVGNERELQP